MKLDSVEEMVKRFDELLEEKNKAIQATWLSGCAMSENCKMFIFDLAYENTDCPYGEPVFPKKNSIDFHHAPIRSTDTMSEVMSLFDQIVRFDKRIKQIFMNNNTLKTTIHY